MKKNLEKKAKSVKRKREREKKAKKSRDASGDKLQLDWDVFVAKG